MIAESAHAASMVVEQAPAAAWTAGNVATIGALIALALGGWNAYLQSKVASLAALWKWKDEFVVVSAANRLADVKEYVTKGELQSLVTRLDKQFDEVKQAIRDLGDKIDQRQQQD